MIAMSPGPNSIAVPASRRMCGRPYTKSLTSRRWQLSPPTVGLTCDDHRQPGSSVSRAKVKTPIVTESIFATRISVHVAVPDEKVEHFEEFQRTMMGASVRRL